MRHYTTIRGSVSLEENIEEIDRATAVVDLYVSELWESAKTISIIHCLLPCRSVNSSISSRKDVRK